MQRAKLDHDGIYWGAEDVEEFSDGDLAVPDECIRPGAYRWDGAHQCWSALDKKARKVTPSAPTLEQAFAAFVEGGAQAPRVQAWLDWYQKSIDGRSA